MKYSGIISLVFSVMIFTTANMAVGQTSEEVKDLEKAIQNPIAAMISLPFQNNTDFGLEPGNKAKNVLNVQPVVPVGLGSKVNLIVRTIIPIVSMPKEVYGEDGGRLNGLGDIALSLFLTPAKPGKLIWGVGPAMTFPTATDPKLGAQKWAAGPSIIALIQPKAGLLGPWHKTHGRMRAIPPGVM